MTLTATSTVNIRHAIPEDIARLTAIYNYYVENTSVSFEEEPIDESEMLQRIKKVREDGYEWFVLEELGVICRTNAEAAFDNYVIGV